MKVIEISNGYGRLPGDVPGKARRRRQFLPGSRGFIRAQIALASHPPRSIARPTGTSSTASVAKARPKRPGAAFGFVVSAG
jgi:hypothetical protein